MVWHGYGGQEDSLSVCLLGWQVGISGVLARCRTGDRSCTTLISLPSLKGLCAPSWIEMLRGIIISLLGSVLILSFSSPRDKSKFQFSIFHFKYGVLQTYIYIIL